MTYANNDEPRQQPNSQHIISDDTSKVWLEVTDKKQENYTTRLASAITWAAFSALAYKLANILSFTLSLSPLVLGLVSLLLIAPMIFHYRSQPVKIWLAIAFICVGIILGRL